MSDNEIKEGSIKYIIDKLIEPKILDMTLTDLANELHESHGITYNWIQDLKRRRGSIVYAKPSAEVLAKLFEKYHSIDI